MKGARERGPAAVFAVIAVIAVIGLLAVFPD